MRTAAVAILAIVSSLGGLPRVLAPLRAQPQEPASSTAPTAPELPKQLETCRAGILDPAARTEDRRRWADLLLTYDSPQARSLAIDLLRTSQRPEVQHALCEAIRDQALTNPVHLDVAFVDPLVDLLGLEAEGLGTSAARTLAEFPGPAVTDRLGEIAADHNAPLNKRLAAINSLAPNTHHREVSRQLMQLVDSPVAEIAERAQTALESAASATSGADVEQWRAWWTARSAYSDEEWLTEQLQIHRDRARRVGSELAANREENRKQQAAVVSQLAIFQRELFRALPAEHRQTKLVEWLDSPLPVVHQTALGIIKARIADEGKRPEGEVLAALLRLLRNGPELARRDVLQVVQASNDPVVVDAVLSYLESETNQSNRREILAAIGKFESPKGIPALIHEIGDPAAHPDCVREAAIALGQVAARADTPRSVFDAVRPLKERFAASSPNDVALRAALLTAMAGVAHHDFAPELLDAVESDDPAILQPAIRGLLSIGDKRRLARFRTLSAHSDAQVRLAAVEAVSELGGEDADLENLLTRINPTIEPSAPVREAAWRGFRDFMGRRPGADRLKAADRLRDTPELEIRYLSELADSASAANGSASDPALIVDRLSAVLAAQGKYAEAAARLGQLFELRVSRGDGSAMETGFRWLDASLRTSPPASVVDVIERLRLLATSHADHTRMFEIVTKYLDSPHLLTDAERSRGLIAELSTIPTGQWPASWRDTLLKAEQRLNQIPPAQSNTP